MNRAIRSVCIALLCMVFMPALCAAKIDRHSEVELRAAVIFGILRFTTWVEPSEGKAVQGAPSDSAPANNVPPKNLMPTLAKDKIAQTDLQGNSPISKGLSKDQPAEGKQLALEGSKAKVMPITLCMVGSPFSGGELMNLNTSYTVKGRPLTIINLSQMGEGVDGCNVVIFGDKQARKTSVNILKQTRGKPIVTICDGCNKSLADSFIIQLVVNKQRIQFKADWQTAKSRGVIFDASLLELSLSKGGYKL